jgi:hypothetical protein
MRKGAVRKVEEGYTMRVLLKKAGQGFGFVVVLLLLLRL